MDTNEIRTDVRVVLAASEDMAKRLRKTDEAMAAERGWSILPPADDPVDEALPDHRDAYDAYIRLKHWSEAT